MPISRYDSRTKLTNVSKNFEEHFQKRDVNFIKHYSSMSLDPEAFSKMKGVVLEYHIWQMGDRLHKLAEQYYGDGRLWFIIALFNSKPTDAHYTIGQTIAIPLPLNKVLEAFGI